MSSENHIEDLKQSLEDFADYGEHRILIEVEGKSTYPITSSERLWSLIKQNQDLAEALEFYADVLSYVNEEKAELTSIWPDEKSAVDEDGGKKARQVLKKHGFLEESND